jgi:phage FluMu gp28-like protein
VRFVVGVDLGQTADYTAITILEERESGSYDVRYLERLRNTPYPQIVRRLDHLVKRLPEKPSMAVDAMVSASPSSSRMATNLCPKLDSINNVSTTTPITVKAASTSS